MKNIVIILGMLFTLSVKAQQVTILGPASICDQTSATLIAQVPGYDTDTLTFQWSLNSQSFSQGINNDTIVVSPGSGVWNYSVSVFTPQGVAVFFPNISGSTGTTTLTVNPNPTGTTIGGAFCENSTISLTGGGGVSYSWSGPNGFSSSLQNPTITQATLAANGTYSLVVSNSFGCSDTSTTQVVINPLPTPTITVSPNDTVCLGTTVALFATGGVSYSWSVGGSGPSTTWTPTTTGNLVPSVFVTDVNGCTALEILPMVVNPTPAVTAVATNTTCFGGSNASITTNVFGGSSFSYLWSNGATTAFVSGLSAGNYSVTVSNNFGCSATATAVVNQPLAAVVVDSLTITNASCNGFSNGSIGVNASGGVGFYSYNWSDGGVGNPRQNLSAGSYTVTVTDGNGCSTTATGVVGQPSAALTANVDSIPVSCFGGSNGSAFVSFISGGTSPYTYLWSNGATGSSTTGLSAGTYTVTITDANGCQVSAGTVVTQPAPVTFTFSQTNVLCNGQATGSITVSANGGIAPYQYRLNNGAWTGANTFSGLTAISYTISVRDTNQCTAGPVNVTITQPTQLQLQMADTNAVCGGNGSVWVLPTGGVAPYSFAWSNGSTNDTISAGPGSYQVTVTDANGCVAIGAATIGQPIIPTIMGSVTHVSCFGLANGGVDITPSGVGPFTYNWTNGSTNQDLVNVGAGIYTVIVIGNNGCIATDLFTVNQPSALTANVPSTTVACNGNPGSLTVSVTGGMAPYSYSWNTVPVQTGITATNLTAGLAYTVIVTDANGCTTQATGSITQPTELSLTVTPQNINCSGNTGSAIATVTGGTPFSGGSYNFLWTNGSQLNQAFGLSFGNHSVTVTDANGCIISQTFSINPGNSFGLSLQATDGCQGQSGGSITTGITGGSGNFSYLWSNGWTGSSLTALTSGTYGVTVTDLNSQCSQFASIQVQVNPAINVTLPSQLTVCSGNTTLVYANVSGGTLPSNFAYQWQLPTGQLQTGVGPTGVNPVVTGLYILTVSEGNCSGSATVFINVSPIAEPVAVFGYVQNNPYNFTFTSSSSNASSLNWFINNQLAGSGQQFTYNFPVTGFYDVKLVASNECGSDTTSQLIGIGVTGISDLESENVKLFPNPISSNGTATVQLPSNIHGVTIQILDLTGKVLSQDNVSGEIHQLNTSGISSGTYIVRIASGAQVVTKRLIIQ